MQPEWTFRDFHGDGGACIEFDAEQLSRRLFWALSALDGPVGSGALAFLLDSGTEEIEAALEDLEDQGLVSAGQLYRSRVWTLAGSNSADLEETLVARWRDRLRKYAMESPAVTLPDMMTLLDASKLEPGERSTVLMAAVREASDLGEFEVLTSLIMALMETDGLSSRDRTEVLRLFQPRRLRGYSVEGAENFIIEGMPLIKDEGEKALALARLGELELVQNRTAAAEEHLMEALRMSVASGSGTYLPSILESLGEIPMDFDSMEAVSSELDSVQQWASGMDDIDLKARILASLALARSGMRKSLTAERTILTAMQRVSSLSPETQLAVEWCRARVYLASGRKKAAMAMLQRSLMLAENVGDQLTVKEILGTLAGEMREKPGYTVRNLITIMGNVSRKASAGGSYAIRAYTLEHLTGMYTRTLQLGEALSCAEELLGISASSGSPSGNPLADWCIAYIGFLAGMDTDLQGSNALLPGTDKFLRALSRGEDPEELAAAMADGFMEFPGSERAVYALFLALEAFARGARKAASVIAAALDSTWGGSSEDAFISWKLCISGILSSREIYSDDFFQSACVVSRQLDRLLLLWLLLRCRLGLDLDRPFRERAAILLLLAELDLFISEQLDSAGAECPEGIFEAGSRMEELCKMACAGDEDGLDELRELLQRAAPPRDGSVIFEIGEIASRISGRSEISASLEIIGRLLRADRVLALRTHQGEIEIIEGYGSGKWRIPGREIEDVITGKPMEHVWTDSFLKSPFGSRRFLVYPLDVSPEEVQKRTLLPAGSTADSFLLAEVDSPFPAGEMIPDFILRSLCGQVGASLRLRSRETMAYMDMLSGAVIGYSWTRRLEEMVTRQSPEKPLSVMLASVDGLKEINRLFGYRVGDGVLRGVVSRMRGVLRPNDQVGRIKGSVFGVILDETGADDARIVADRVCGAVAGMDVRPDRVPVTMSVGTSTVTAPAEAHDLILSRAAEAMAEARSAGGNMAVSWTREVSLRTRGQLLIYSTGDPGWDHSICTSVMDVLTEGEPDLELLAEKLRDALRSQMVHIDDGRGNEAFVGSRFMRSISREVGESRMGYVSFHASMLGRYDVLATGLQGGGRLIGAWEETEEGPGLSLKNVFLALSTLSSRIIDGMS